MPATDAASGTLKSWRLTPSVLSCSQTSTVLAVASSISPLYETSRGCGFVSQTPPGGSSGPRSRPQILLCLPTSVSKSARNCSNCSGGITSRSTRYPCSINSSRQTCIVRPPSLVSAATEQEAPAVYPTGAFTLLQCLRQTITLVPCASFYPACLPRTCRGQTVPQRRKGRMTQPKWQSLSRGSPDTLTTRTRQNHQPCPTIRATSVRRNRRVCITAARSASLSDAAPICKLSPALDTSPYLQGGPYTATATAGNISQARCAVKRPNRW